MAKKFSEFLGFTKGGNHNRYVVGYEKNTTDNSTENSFLEIVATTDADETLKMYSADKVDELISAGTGGGTSAEYVTYTNTDLTGVTNVKEALDEIVEEMLYTPILITDLTSSNGVGPFETGTTLSNTTFSWTMNKVPTTQTFDGASVPVGTTSKIVATINASKSFTLNVNDGKNSNARTLNVSIADKMFFGANATTPTTSANVRALSGSSFGNSFTIPVDTTNLKYHFVIPATKSVYSVIDSGNLNANITSSYVKGGNITVTQAGSATKSYSVYTLTLGTAYPSNTNHIVTLN